MALLSDVPANSAPGSPPSTASPALVVFCGLHDRQPYRSEAIPHRGLIFISLTMVLWSIFSYTRWPFIPLCFFFFLFNIQNETHNFNYRIFHYMKKYHYSPTFRRPTYDSSIPPFPLPLERFECFILYLCLPLLTLG